MAFEKFKKFRFTAVTKSAGTSFKPYYEAIPKDLRKGTQNISQGGFFNYTKVQESPEKYHVEVDDTTGEKATYIEREEYRDRMLDYIKAYSGLPSSVTASISASFFAKIGSAVTNLPAGEFVAILSPNTPQHPTASMVYEKHPGILNPGYLVIKNTSEDYSYSHFKFGYEYSEQRTGGNNLSGQVGQHRYTSGSAATTHITRSFLKESFLLGQDDVTPYWSIKFVQPSADVSIFPSSHQNAFSNGVMCFALTSSITTSADFGCVASSSTNFTGSWLMHTGSSTPGRLRSYQMPYNGINGDDGCYSLGEMKGLVSGESFNVSTNSIPVTDRSYLPIKQFVYYSSSQAVQSGTFNYNSSSAFVASSSGTSITLYYASSSLGKGPSGSYTGSFIGDDTKWKSGSHLWLDSNLTTPASAGFYAIPGTKYVLGAHIGYNMGPPNNIWTGVSSSITGSGIPDGASSETVPRWTSKSIH